VLDIVDDCGVDWIAGLKWMIVDCYGEECGVVEMDVAIFGC